MIERTVQKLYEKKLLDDESFAKTFVSDRIRRTTKGPLIIQQELLQKGITIEHIEAALTLYDEKTQLQRALIWAKNEWKKSSKQPYNKRIEQLKAKLIRRGFTIHIVTNAIEQLELEQDEDEEWKLLKKRAISLYNSYRRKYNEKESILRLKQRL